MLIELLGIVFGLRGSPRQVLGKLLMLLVIGFLFTNDMVCAYEGSQMVDIWISADAYLLLGFLFFCQILMYEFKADSKIVAFFKGIFEVYKEQAFPKLEVGAKKVEAEPVTKVTIGLDMLKNLIAKGRKPKVKPKTVKR